MSLTVHGRGALSGPSEADRAVLDEAAGRYAAAANAAGTRRAYLSDLRDFAAWCDDFDLAPLPAEPLTVARYLADLAERGRTVSTIDRRVAAIAYAHRAKGFDTPTASERVRSVLTGIRNTLGRRPQKKRALTVELVAKVIKRIPRDLRGSRDRAMILLAFGAALRRSELVALDVHDLEPHRRGLLVRLRRSKTDQAGDGRTIAVPAGKLKVPDAVAAWLKVSGIAEGPAFRGFDGDRLTLERLSDGQFARMLKRRCAAAGLDPVLFSGHSPRRGFASSAGDHEADLRHIATHMRHAKLETTMGYIEDAELFRDSAGKSFL